MTLWDFYRTLPYPLPIKKELDEIKADHQDTWLGALVNRLVTTEACAREQLSVPLAALFAHSEPRKKPATFDDESQIEHENYHRTSVIPKNKNNSNNPHHKRQANKTTHKAHNNIITEADNPAVNPE